MPLTPYCVRVETAEDLEYEVNLALLPLLANKIFGVEIDQTKPGPPAQRNIYAAFTYSDGAPVIPTPFRFRAFSSTDESSVILLINQFIAANPAYFFSEVFFFYRPQSNNPNEGVSAGIFYNVTAAVDANWGGGAGANVPGGPAGGDLSGNYPNPTVAGIRGIPIAATPPSQFQTYVYDAVSGELVPALVIKYYVSLAAAVAAEPFVLGTTVVISPGSPTSEAGTYQVTANTGNPADFTKLSDLTDTASEVGIVDAGGYFPGATNVEEALQQVGAGLSGAVTIPLPDGATTVLDTLAKANYGEADWSMEFVKGILRFSCDGHATHNDTTAVFTEDAESVGPGITVLPFSLDANIVGANLVLSVTVNALATGWTCFLKRTGALPAAP
jgi:hypothetical protein